MDVCISYGAAARDGILRGVERLKKGVASTLGPKGHNVIIYKNGARPLITKDGASVAAEVDSEDPFEKIGILLTKDVISKVNSIAGDGTTTTTIYTYTLMRSLNKFVNLGVDPNELRKGMNAATEKALELLNAHTIPSANIEQVANVAVNGDSELAKLMASGYNSIGENGCVILADSYKRDGSSYMEVSNGIKWNQGIPSSLFITDPVDDTCRLEAPYIMVIASGVKSLEPLAAHMKLVKDAGRNFAIIAPYFEPELYSDAASQGVALIESPGDSLDQTALHEALMDLAVTIGTKVVPDAKSAKSVVPTLDDLGVANMIISTLKGTTITQVDELSEEQAKKYQEYIDKLKSQIDDNDELTIKTTELLKERLARLSGGIATIYIGALTPEEREEKIALAEDAQCSIRSALDYGVLPGGGTAMLKVAQALSEMKTPNLSAEARKGWEAVIEALSEPAKELIKSVKPNDYQYLVQQVAHESSFDKGYNVRTETIEDLKESGIIDSAAISQTLLKNAASMIGAFVISDGVITLNKQGMSYDLNDRRAVEAR